MIKLNNDKPNGEFSVASYTNIQLTELTEPETIYIISS